MATTTVNTTTLNSTSNSAATTADVHKLKSLTEKLRLEISELRDALHAEKLAVRELRVRNDKDVRKHRRELHAREQQFKRQLSETAHNSQSRCRGTASDATRKHVDSASSGSNSSDFCENCRRLVNENKTLKQTNKDVEERLHNVLEADRIKASDLRSQHENHLIELQRIQRSTRIETQRLLEELKTKDHLIDQLKRRRLPPPPPQQQPLNRIPPNIGKTNKSTQTTELMRKLINNCDTTTTNVKHHIVNDTKQQQSTPQNVIIESTDIVKHNNNKIDVIDMKQQCYYQPTTMIQQTTSNETGTTIKTGQEMPTALKERLSGVAHFIVDESQLFTINNQKQYLKEENFGNDTIPQTQINKHRKELYYRPLVDIERSIVEEDTDSAVSSAPSSLSPQPYHHVSSSSNSPLHHSYNNNHTTIQQQQQQQQPTITASPVDIWYRHHHTTSTITSQNGINTTNIVVNQQSNNDIIGNNETTQQCALEKGELQTELAIAKCQVRELERALLVTREIKNNNQNNTNTNNSTITNIDNNNNNSNTTINILKERIRYLETNEQQLLQQLQQLREQNELQEFRILELEECHEKWSLRSQSSSELRDIETSRVVTPITTSIDTDPDPDHHDPDSDEHDSNNMNSEHDLIREHLLIMLNKTQDPNDKHCLQQVTTLLDNLETLSQEHSNCVCDDDNDNDHCHNFNIDHDNDQYYSNTKTTITQSTTVTPTTTTTINDDNNNENDDDDDDKFTKHLILKKKQLSQANSLQESGIFEGDDVQSVQTQTDQHIDNDNMDDDDNNNYYYHHHDDLNYHENNVTNKSDIRLSELTAEIQKLNQIRASIEENGKSIPTAITTSTSAIAISSSSSSTSTTTTNQQQDHQQTNHTIYKELEYYKNRLEQLENKINIYESSGDMQMKRLKERLNHEIVLTTQVTDLQAKLLKLENDNKRLEEEKCEFEEAENDTRLQYQQLEIDLKMTQEYLHDLEEARNAVKRKLKETKQDAQYWEQMFTRCDARNYELEEYQLELQCKYDFFLQILPILILFNIWLYQQQQQQYHQQHDKYYLKSITYHLNTNNSQTVTPSMNCNIKNNINNNQVTPSMNCCMKNNINNSQTLAPSMICNNNNKMAEIIESNKELRKQIEIYKQREDAYIETLQQADNIWAEMEMEYKKRIQIIEDNELQLQIKVKQLEDNDTQLRKNIEEFNERILELEDIERHQYEQIKLYENEKKYLQKENLNIKDELHNAKNEWYHIKENLEGVCHTEMERLRKKIRTLQDDLDISTKMIDDTEESYQKEITILKIQLQKLNKELLHLDITNSELREFITQYETRISELQTQLFEQRLQYERTIKNLTMELMSQREQHQQQQQQCLFRKRSFSTTSSPPLSFDHMLTTPHTTSSTNLVETTTTPLSLQHNNNNVLSLRDELQKSDSNLNNNSLHSSLM